MPGGPSPSSGAGVCPLVRSPEGGTPNPEPGRKHLSTAVDLADDTASVALALSVADYFRLGNEAANDVVAQVQSAVSQWATVARRYGLSSQEVTAMSWAFEAHSTHPHR